MEPLRHFRAPPGFARMSRILILHLSYAISFCAAQLARIREAVQPGEAFDLCAHVRQRQTINLLRSSCTVLSRPKASRRVMLMVAQ
jgi:hypothetical protein